MSDSYLAPAPAPAPRQLDIIADTILRGVETRTDLSTGTARETRTDLSTAPRAQTRTDLSTKLKQMAERRKKVGISVARWLAVANVTRDTYFSALKGASNIRQSTVEKLAAALDALSAGEAPAEKLSLCQAYLRSMTVQLAIKTGWDPELMLSQNFAAENSNDPVWLQASRLRRCAVYLLVEGLNLGKANIGRAIGVSRQAIHKSVAAIEAERDRDAIFDGLMSTMMLQVKGERL